ncbi:hypothetical protein JTE90_024218 [Oedothorax gibbosus]|uniref:Uncharacterized protein n=1 Tax=Oedothorax gibbosus TaxID=931172 RepID=A0AAV6U915_9ARAC|nr:hypothetical protein JTE90_024218 [Oedothorax gibbosus]
MVRSHPHKDQRGDVCTPPPTQPHRKKDLLVVARGGYSVSPVGIWRANEPSMAPPLPNRYAQRSVPPIIALPLVISVRPFNMLAWSVLAFCDFPLAKPR